ncbi:MAG: hypothetical protein IQL11_00405 [Bacteroidales bacterium]|nr:hypothetical protein [Bacteroidales bacterium]
MPIWSSEIKELEKLFESFKGQLPDLEKELERLIKAEDENMVLVYARRCLEVIITDLCESELKRHRKTEPLQGIIDKLNKEEKVPSHIIASMHGLNGMSTFGTHPKDFDPEQIKPVLNNLDIIIKWYLKYREPRTIGKASLEKEEVQYTEPMEGIRKEEQKEVNNKSVKSPRQKLLSGALLTAILVIAAILTFPKTFKRNTLERLRSSGDKIVVAVMPFQNLTNDSVWDVWQEGIQDNLIASLSNSVELKVRQAESITGLLRSNGFTNYASVTPDVGSKISQKLDANIFVSGSINKAGPSIRLNAQLIDPKTEEVFKSFQLNGTADRILNVLDSLAIEVKNFLIITKLKKGQSPDDFQLVATTYSPEAYSLFLLGNKAYRNADFFSAYEMYLQAIAIDTNFVEAFLKLSVGYYNEYLYDEAKKWCLKAFEKKDQMPLRLKININRVYSLLFETHYEEIKYLRQLQEIDDLLPGTYYSLGYSYSLLLQFEKAIPEYEKSLEIYDKLGIRPAWVFNYTQLGEAYNKTGQFKKEKRLYQRAEKDFPDNLVLTYNECLLAAVEGDTINEEKYLNKALRLAKENSWTEPNASAQMAFGYFEIGKEDKAEQYYRHALILEPEKPERRNNLAFFLIDSERNIEEGMKLVEEALDLSPDNYLFLDTKGWGLYKQGRYSEANEIIRKSWDLRKEKAVYDHKAFLRLDEVKKAFENKK